MKLTDWQQRVIEEKQQLDEKIAKLTAFMKGDTFQQLSQAQRTLLERQEIYMLSYSEVLIERIESFTFSE